MGNYCSIKDDFRSRLTKQMLSGALLECFRTMTYPEITVIKICNVAQVHRTTFYKHFETKDDLLKYTIYKKYLAPGIEYSKKNKSTSTSQERFINVISLMLDIFFSDKDYFYITLGTKENDAVMMTLTKQLTEFMKQLLEDREEDKELPANVFAEYTAGGIVNFINSCVHLKMPYTKEKMMSYILKLTVFY